MESQPKIPIFLTILIIALLAVIFMIYKNYQTELTGKSFLLMVYLYIIVGLLFIAVVGKLTESMSITDAANTWKLTILYFVMACGGISLMMSNQFLVNHTGYILMLLALGLIMGSLYKYGINVAWAATITAIIVAVLTLVVFNSSEESLLKMASWLPNLTSILCIIIIIELIYMFFFGYNSTFTTIMSISIVVLFAFFILSDTSRILGEAKNLQCNTQMCINYPLRASGLVLDYYNMFVALVYTR